MQVAVVSSGKERGVAHRLYGFYAPIALILLVDVHQAVIKLSNAGRLGLAGWDLEL